MPEYNQMLIRLRKEAQRIQEQMQCSLDLAYERAFPRIIMAEAEALDVSPFQAKVLDKISELSPRDSDPPVPTKRLVAEIGTKYDTLRYHLLKMEEKALIARPNGERSGWKAA